MKVKSLAIAALLGLVTLTSDAQGVNVFTDMSNTVISKNKKDGKSMVSVGLSQIEYQNSRYQEYQNPISYNSRLALAQALEWPIVKGKDGQMMVQAPEDKSEGSKHTKVDVSMINLKNMGYEGTFQFGNPSQEMQVIFDTGSAWAWVFSEDCGKKGVCPTKNKKFLQSKSDTFKMNAKGGQMLQYGRGAILGHPSEDKGCFSSDSKSCMSKFNFLTVVKGKDLESLQGSGLIGLAPTPAKGNEMDKPMENGIAGFVAQLKANTDFNKEFDQQFSIYLSNDGSSPGDITFGGYDLEKYAKKGKEVMWVDQAANEAYWSVNSKEVKMGDKQLSQNNQQVIFDNGMSLAMAPEKSFVEILKLLAEKGIKCQETTPVWSCATEGKETNSLFSLMQSSEGVEKIFDTLPSIDMNLMIKESGEIGVVKMPPKGYMKFDEKQNVFFLLITPWQFQGLGGKPGEEYWVMGAQFLQNYYTIYDFKNKKVGLVESSTSIL